MRDANAVRAGPLFVASFLVAGFCTVVGSILGNAWHQTRILYLGAVVGGLLGCVLAARLAARLGWVPRERVRATALGAAAGFAVATPIAVTNLHTPVTPILATMLVGLGAVLGARRRPSSARAASAGDG
ncbi:MAG: hypothetical protein ACJ8AO_14575 [Gemmatimonadaceae bacterium]